MVTHRDAPLRLADKIYRLEQGQLIQQNAVDVQVSGPKTENAIRQIL